MLIDLVRMVRANKNLNWDEYMRPEDWDIINSIILPATWYPFSFYARLGWASFKLVGSGNLGLARVYGQVMAQKLFETIYKSMVKIKDPSLSLRKFVLTYGGFFNFSSLKFEKVDTKKVKIHHDYSAVDRNNVPYCHQLLGMVKKLVEMTGGRNCKVVFLAKQWDGAPATTYGTTWD